MIGQFTKIIKQKFFFFNLKNKKIKKKDYFWSFARMRGLTHAQNNAYAH